jgi:hypothetical protein
MRKGIQRLHTAYCPPFSLFVLQCIPDDEVARDNNPTKQLQIEHGEPFEMQSYYAARQSLIGKASLVLLRSALLADLERERAH